MAEAGAAILALASLLTARHGGECVPVHTRYLVCSQPFAANGRAEAFTVYLPATAKPGRAILLLHGAGRDHRTPVDNPATRSAIDATASAIVFPRGAAAWWVDTPGSRYETFALEAMDRVAAALRIPADAEHWSAAGWSMGGFGSLRLVERHAERFSAWAGILALADFPNAAYPGEQNHSVPRLLGPPAAWAEWNPLGRAAALRGKRLWFATADGAFDRSMNQALDRKLTALGIPHEFRTFTGGHEFRVVQECLPAALEFLTGMGRE